MADPAVRIQQRPVLPTQTGAQEHGLSDEDESRIRNAATRAEGNRVAANDEDTFERSVPQTAGIGATTTWDTAQRDGYLRQIKRSSAAAVRDIDTARVNGDLGRAEQTARDVSDRRNQLRQSTQRRLTPGGRVLSGAIEQDRSWSRMTQKYGDGSFDNYRSIAQASGRSNPLVTGLQRFGRVAGPIGVAVGAGVAAHRIANAPPEERGRVAAEETGGVVGGAVGATAGTAAGALAGVGAAALLASNPVGWAIGLGLAGSAVAGYFGSEWGRSAGRAIYNWFN